MQHRLDAPFHATLPKGHGTGGKSAVGAAIQEYLGISGAFSFSELPDDLFVTGQLNVPAQQQEGLNQWTLRIR